MRHPLFRAIPSVVMLGAALPALAQGFDPATQAKGWAHQDRDFSFTFYDPASRSLVTWDKGFGVMNTLSLAKLEAEPEMWFLDRYNNAWVVSGDMLYFVLKDGKVDRKEKLPAPVADVAWDSQTGFVLCYRTATPYLEMRDYKKADVLWTHGDKPKKGEAVPSAPFRLCLKVQASGSSQVYVTDGSGLDFLVLSGKNGDQESRTSFRLGGQALPSFDFAKAAPGPVCPLLGKEIIYAALDSRSVPASAAPGLNGLLLARLDLASEAVTFEPTGLTPDHRFIGVVDGQAVFVKPVGGLAFVPVQ